MSFSGGVRMMGWLPVDAGSVLESIAEGLFTVDENYRITSFNRAAEMITGVPREEAIGRPCHEVMRVDLCRRACALREAGESGSPIECCRARRRDDSGRTRDFNVSANVLESPEGKVVGGVVTFRDLSQMRADEEHGAESVAFRDIISRSERMHGLFRVLGDVAQSEATVLIEGPSGSGKELVARAIHRLSRRSRGPWVAVNCGALPDTLLESELFGHVRGAFTDARTDRQGRFAAADGGTIFLDEIGDVSPAMQVRLLRVLQERCFEPVGSSQPRRANVRVIAATNRSLRHEVERGRFREDLFYRLNVMRLEIPPLSERPEDIPLLADHFIERLRRDRGREIVGLSDAALEALRRHRWPGNVRELENAIEHAFILCHDRLIRPEHLPHDIARHTAKAPETPGMDDSLRGHEERVIRETLERHDWHRLETARTLGINKTTLWRKMKRLGIVPPPGH